MNLLDAVGLKPLMEIGSGAPETVIGLLDGPVATDHPDLMSKNIRETPGGPSGDCLQTPSEACRHGTFIAGILSARRGSAAPAICPGCTLLLRPIFKESTRGGNAAPLPTATPAELAEAIIECVDGGPHVLNLSAAFAQPSTRGERHLEEALDYAAGRGVIVVAASGNQGTLGSSVITRHPWVIPVVACDVRGRPVGQTNLGGSIGRRGLCAPGDSITSLEAGGGSLTSGGTSVAAPFVTGAIALLWSVFPRAEAPRVKFAVTETYGGRRNTVVPPLLDARAAYQAMAKTYA
jgi:subtilisin family serine protease